MTEQQDTAATATAIADDVRVCHTWCGGPARVVRGPLAKMRDHVPTFNRRLGGRRGFRITRNPLPGQDGPEKQLAEVTPVYHLVQHREVLDAVAARIDKAGVAVGAMATMVLGPDERQMDLTVELPSMMFTPYDGYCIDARVNVRNSVDKSCALFGGVGFLRMVCANGMVGWDGTRMRRVHNGPLVLPTVMAHVAGQLGAIGPEQQRLNALLDCKVDVTQVAELVDTVLPRKWGRSDAVQVYHVARYGRYGIPEISPGQPPHHDRIKWSFEAPGACAPVTNLYHLMQALSYVASRSTPYETRLARLGEVYAIVEPLLK
jgi:hypothetical protein